MENVLHSYRDKNNIKTILLNNVEVTNDFDMEQLFNNFFTGVATGLDEADIAATNTDPSILIFRVDASLFLYPVLIEKRTNAISTLKNSIVGFDQLHLKVQNCLMSILSPMIS